MLSEGCLEALRKLGTDRRGPGGRETDRGDPGKVASDSDVSSPGIPRVSLHLRDREASSGYVSRGRSLQWAAHGTAPGTRDALRGEDERVHLRGSPFPQVSRVLPERERR